MPTPRPLHRTYCKTCQDFTIHTADYVCQTCNTEITSYFPSEVDSDLVEQQRKRYTKQRQAEVFRGSEMSDENFTIKTVEEVNNYKNILR